MRKEKMAKKRMILAMALVFALAMTAFGNAAAAEYKMGLAVANLQAEFFNMIRTSAEARAKELGIEIVTLDAGGDAETQVNQIKDLITQGVDAIIYIPAGASAATVPVNDAKAAGIPVVTVDRNPDGAPGGTFIATNSVDAAKELGEWVVEQTGGKGKLGIVGGQTGTTPEQDRTKGFSEALAGSEVEQIWRQDSGGWHQDEGFAITQDALQVHPNTTIIFGQADALALGAAQAARTANISGILIVGFDGDEAGLRGVANGTIDATMCQQTYLMGALAVDSAIKLINGETLPAEQLLPATLVTTKEDAEKYLLNHP